MTSSENPVSPSEYCLAFGLLNGHLTQALNLLLVTGEDGHGGCRLADIFKALNRLSHGFAGVGGVDLQTLIRDETNEWEQRIRHGDIATSVKQPPRRIYQALTRPHTDLTERLRVAFDNCVADERDRMLERLGEKVAAGRMPREWSLQTHVVSPTRGTEHSTAPLPSSASDQENASHEVNILTPSSPAEMDWEWLEDCRRTWNRCGLGEFVNCVDGESQRQVAQRLLTTAEERIRNSPNSAMEGSIRLERGPDVRGTHSLQNGNSALDVSQSSNTDRLRNEFRWDGVRWQIAFNGKREPRKNRAGFDFLTILLGTPGRTLSADELTAPWVGNVTLAETGLEQSGMQINQAGLPVIDKDSIPILEAEITRLTAERSEAESSEDLEEYTRLDRERSAVIKKLKNSARRGEPRIECSPRKRNMDLVRVSLKRVLMYFAVELPEFDEHLDKCLVMTNGRWTYTPDGDVEWWTERRVSGL
jgi:hypothetical protein